MLVPRWWRNRRLECCCLPLRIYFSAVSKISSVSFFLLAIMGGKGKNSDLSAVFPDSNTFLVGDTAQHEKKTDLQ